MSSILEKFWKKSFWNIFIVGAGNGISSFLGLLFFTAVARTLSIEDFGKYALLSSLLVSLSKGLDFGANSSFVAKSITKTQKYTNSFFSLKVLLFFAVTFIGTASLYFLGLFSPHILFIFVIGAVGYGINIVLFALFQREEKFVLAVMLDVIPGLIKASLAVMVLTGIFSPDLTAAFAIFSSSILSSTLLIFWLPKKYLKAKIGLQGVRSFFMETLPAGISQVIKVGWPAIANSIAKLARTFSDVGIFSLAQKIADVFTLISFSVFTVLLPMNAQRKKDNQRYDLKETVTLAGGILLFAFVAMIMAHYLTVPIFGEKFTGSLSLLNVLILAAALTSIHTFMDNYFFIEEKTKLLMGITLSKLGVFIIAAFALIPSGGLAGLASANLISALFAVGITFGVISGSRSSS